MEVPVNGVGEAVEPGQRAPAATAKLFQAAEHLVAKGDRPGAHEPFAEFRLGGLEGVIPVPVHVAQQGRAGAAVAAHPVNAGLKVPDQR